MSLADCCQPVAFITRFTCLRFVYNFVLCVKGQSMNQSIGNKKVEIKKVIAKYK